LLFPIDWPEPFGLVMIGLDDGAAVPGAVPKARNFTATAGRYSIVMGETALLRLAQGLASGAITAAVPRILPAATYRIAAALRPH
jgi:hypothetical protein